MKFRYDIAVTRLMSILVVCFFHCYGMMFAQHLCHDVQMQYKVYEHFNQYYLINIAMPMFTLISGFLFGGQLLRKEPSFRDVVSKKFMRLMVPFFVFATIFMLTQNAFNWQVYYKWSYSHLWYLPMLFWCFVATYIIRKLLYNIYIYISILTLIILFAISLCGIELPFVLGIQNVPAYLGYFALGAWFYKYEDRLLGSRKRQWCIVIVGTIIYFAIWLTKPFEYYYPTVLGLVGILAALFAIWTLMRMIPWDRLKITGPLVELSKYSFGVYIFHNWVATFIISTTAQRLFPLNELAADHIILFPLCFSLLTFGVSVALTWLLMRFRLGRALIR